MKSMIATALVAFSLLSSFTNSKPVTSNSGPYQIDETFTLPDMEVGFCNGETVLFPELTMQVVGQGVLNNKVNVLRVETTFSGTGTSTLTGKAFVFHEVIAKHEKIPLVNGAYLQKSRVVTTLTNEEGQPLDVTMIYHLTVNAKGQSPAVFVKMIGSCQ